MAELAERDIAFEISSARGIPLPGGRSMRLQAGQRMDGRLSVERWDGPMGREYSLPSFYRIAFAFPANGRMMVYRNEVTPHDLVPKNGENCALSAPDFEESLPGIQWLFDSGATLALSAEDGTAVEIVVKNMDCVLSLMLGRDAFRIKCRYYDLQRGDYSTIFLTRPYDRLLFLPAIMIVRDREGRVEDWIPHGEEYVLVDEG